MPAMTLTEIRQLVNKNNRSSFLSDEFIICQIWKECGFRPRRNESGSSAAGMMQMTKGAIKDVNNSLGKHAKHYTEQDMSDNALNIQCGTLYLDIRIKRAGNNIKAGVNGYGTGDGYVDLPEKRYGRDQLSGRYSRVIRHAALGAFLLLAAPAMAATGWGNLSNWVGHYPDEKLGPAGAELLKIPAIQAKLKQVLPASDFKALGKNYTLADQVSQVGHYLLADFCTAHNCGASNVTIVLDQSSDNLWVAFFSQTGTAVSTRWYGTADYAELPTDVQNAVIAVHRPAN